MKAVFYILLLANGVYFSWQLGMDRSEDAAIPQTGSEQVSWRNDRLVTVAESVKTLPSADVPTNKLAKTLLPEPAAPESSLPGSLPESLRGSSSVQLSAPTQTATPSIEPPSIGSPAPVVVAIKPPVEPACLVVSGFVKREPAAKMAADLAAVADVTAAVEEQITKRRAGYRVQLGPYPSLRQARSTRKELIGKGVSDLAVRQENGNYFVSLGFFSKVKTRDYRNKQIAALGYRPSIQEVIRRDVRYRVKVRDASAGHVIRSKARKQLASLKSMKVSDSACE